ncbi:MAG: hypothetical protein JSR58_07700 [Verrucomicrobia bacterium]|nr:hypothetical protein [Verrucomicrobiota bacterium]
MEIVKSNTSTVSVRKFQDAEVSWALEQLYGTPSKCGETWNKFKFIGRRVDAIRNSKFVCRHFTTLGGYQEAVISAVAKNKLDPSGKSEAALNTALDQWVSFIDKHARGTSTFDTSDNRALLFYTARAEILEMGPSIAGDTSFEKGFYNRVVNAQVHVRGNGIDIVRDLDAIVESIQQISGKATPQIMRDVSLPFGYQFHPEDLLKLPAQTADTKRKRTAAQVQDSIAHKAWVLVNYSDEEITEDVVKATLGKDTFHIDDVGALATALETLRQLPAEKKRLEKTVADAIRAHLKAKTNYARAKAGIEKLQEEQFIAMNNRKLFDKIIDPVLTEIDQAIIGLAQNKKLDQQSLSQAFGNRQALIDDFAGLATDLNKLGVAGHALSDLEKAQVKLCIRQHITLDTPIEGTQSFLFGKREASKINPKLKEIKDYLVWRAGLAVNEELLKVLSASKPALETKQKNEKQQLSVKLDNDKEGFRRRLDKAKVGLQKDRANHPINAKLQNALTDFQGLLNYPSDLKSAEKLRLEAGKWAETVAKEIFAQRSGLNTTLNPQALQDNERYLAQLMGDIPLAIAKWIEVEKSYEDAIKQTEHGCIDGIKALEETYRNDLQNMEQRHIQELEQKALPMVQLENEINTLKSNITNSDALRNTPTGRYKLTPDYMCDFALRLNIPNTPPVVAKKGDVAQNLVANISQRIQPLIANHTVEQGKLNEFITAMLLVTAEFENLQNAECAQDNAETELLLFNAEMVTDRFTNQAYLEEREKGTREVITAGIASCLVEGTIDQAFEDRNRGVAARVNNIYDNVIIHTWDVMTKGLTAEDIWRTEAAVRIVPVLTKVCRKQPLEAPDVVILSRARKFADQIEMSQPHRDAISKADLKDNTNWDETTIDAFTVLLKGCHRFILNNELVLKPVQRKKSEVEEVSLPAKKSIPKNDKDEEESLVNNRLTKAHSREPALNVQKVNDS